MAESTPVCIFLDALDEYNHKAEPTQLMELIRGLSLEKNVKLCVSSRPEQQIRDELHVAHLLRLQDLTGADINRFVLDKLGQAFQKRNVSLSQNAQSRLVDELTNKAEGVFLWVSLALEDIRRGLSNYDTFTQLMRRVSRLPAEVEKLYENMLQRLGDDWQLYQQEAALYFKICLTLSDLLLPTPNGLIFFAMSADQILHNLSPLSASDIDLGELLRRCHLTESRIASCCAGMLETQRSDTCESYDGDAKGAIEPGTSDV
ncbi:hypothetical protein GJ744_001931 [Endocarpon pusillum]|uniref:NACHT domain-containing protein n=1 Tax=Endocarpon pusillum TaxID=364733 RepID=A0A8H7ANG8_9EURO|nr:hypothetical protein GJ744_001931 [Endocarpon pusillum]